MYIINFNTLNTQNYKKMNQLKKLFSEILKHTDHSHAPNIAKSEAKELVNEIKKSAENGQFSTRNIISTKLGEASASVIGQLPTIKSMLRTIQRTRITKENPPVNPSNVNDLLIPEIYKFTNKNELFLSYD
ncbi:FLYWCH-type zinc finger-containing protein 1-like, partial [Aphis craccivora]